MVREAETDGPGEELLSALVVLNEKEYTQRLNVALKILGCRGYGSTGRSCGHGSGMWTLMVMVCGWY